MKKLLALFVFLTAFLVASHAHAAVYYFNNAVNTDPAEIGNYWNDEGLSDPVLALPDNTVDEITVVSDAIYDGDAIFNGESSNRGTVTGDATFVNDLSEDYGTVDGTRIRRYTVDISTSRDFTSGGDWTIIADGAEVNVVDATFNADTLFTSTNEGVVIYASLVTPIVNKDSVILIYNQDLDTNSIPDTDNFIIAVNGDIHSVEDVSISGKFVELTLESDVSVGDTVILSYVPGVYPVQSELASIPVQEIDETNLLLGVIVGDTPLYATSTGKKIYINNSAASSVSVLDTNINEVVGTITTDGNNAYASSTVGQKMYIINSTAGTVSVIDIPTDTVIATITVGSNAYSSTIFGTKLYVENAASNTVSIIDTDQDVVEETVNISGTSPYFSVNVGNKVYVINFASNSVSVIDFLTNTETDTISVGDMPYYAVTVGNKVYVFNTGSASISVIDTNTDTVSTTILVGNNPYSGVIYREKLYVNNTADGTVSVINLNTDTVIDTISVGQLPYYSVVVGDKIFTSNSGDNTTSLIDTQTDTVIDTLTVAKNAQYLNTVDRNVYFLGRNDNVVSIIGASSVPSLLPNLLSFSTSSSSGTYTPGQSIPLTATFGRALASGSTMTVLLNTGRSVTLNNVSGSTLSGTYTIQSGDTTPDLAVRSITSASVTDLTNTYTRTAYDLPSSVGDFEAENSFITRNLGDVKNIQIGDYQSFATGDAPYQLTSPINGFLYVANQGAGTVSVVNATTGVLADTIDVGDEPYGLAVVGTELYVANTGSDTVSVINTATNTVTHTINVGVKPYYVATIGTNVYVTNSMSNTVSVIDAGTHAVTDTIPVGSYPRGIKSHGTDLYVANYGDPNYSGGNYISVIDSLTNEVSDTIILPAGSDGPRGVTTLGDNVYVSNFRSNNISVIDTATNEITDTIAVGTGPRGLLGTGTTLYVQNFDDGTISVIDTNSNTVTDTVDVGHSPAGMSLSGTTLYITSFQDDRVYAMNTTTNTLIEEGEEENSRESSKSGSYVSFSPVVVPVSNSAPTDCLPSYKFSPSTGKPCVANSTPTTPSTPPSSSPAILSPFTRDLKLGMIGPDVKALQVYLNTHGFPVAVTGLGSKGFETTKFGSLTQKALIKFQIANKITPAIGYFGPKTRAVVNTIK